MTARWLFVGAGNMAGSIVSGMVDAGNDANDIAVFDLDSATAEALAGRTGCRAVGTLDAAMPVDGVVIAVKPDGVSSVCATLSALSQPPSLVVSVAAGVRETAMRGWLPAGTAIVRCMPNTPALLGLGASGLYANDATDESQKAHAVDMLESVGRVFVVDEEQQLDAVTAVSGSGPAYFFYLVEHMARTGMRLGLPDDVARELAIETGFGATSMARQGDDDPGELRRKVTSKGGTTAAAISVFDEQDLPGLLDRAMQGAFDRAGELGDEFS